MIPRLLHHVWVSSYPLQSWFLHNLHSWRNAHPAWEHFLWTTDRLPSLQNGSTFFRSTNAEERFDIVRMELLLQFGGIVLPPTVECLKPLHDLMGDRDSLVIGRESFAPIVGSIRDHFPLHERSLQLLRRKMGRVTKLPDEPASLGYRQCFGIEENLSDEDHVRWCNPDVESKLIRYLPEHLVIAVKTIDREPQYIHKTLASMFAADEWVRRTGEVLLLPGCEDIAYLADYLHHEGIRVIPLTVEEAATLAPMTRKKSRAAFNRCRSLRIPLEGKLGVLVVEDDVVFRDHFVRRLLATIEEMEQGCGLSEYALALFSIHDLEMFPETRRGTRFCRYDAPFSATQGMYYSAGVTQKLAQHVEAHAIRSYRLPGDLLVGEFMRGRIYATPRFLVQHTGEVSTGLGGTHMDRSVFYRPYSPLSEHDYGRPSASLFPRGIEGKHQGTTEC